MVRILAIILLSTACGFGADSPVLIQDTLSLQSPTLWNGEITVSWPSFTASGGTQVAKGSRTFTVVDGAVSISLYSTVGASPSFLYTARYRSTDAATRGLTSTETWYVPASGPVELNDVRRSSTIGIGVTYRGHYAGRPTSPHLLDMVVFDDAATSGSCSAGGGTGYSLCIWDSATWQPLGGSGSTTLRWTTLTNTQWTSLTNSQWTALTN